MVTYLDLGQMCNGWLAGPARQAQLPLAIGQPLELCKLPVVELSLQVECLCSRTPLEGI